MSWVAAKTLSPSAYPTRAPSLWCGQSWGIEQETGGRRGRERGDCTHMPRGVDVAPRLVSRGEEKKRSLLLLLLSLRTMHNPQQQTSEPHSHLRTLHTHKHTPSFPYAAALAAAGIWAWLTEASKPSLVAGAASSAILGAAGLVSLKAYDAGRLSKPATAVSLAVALALAAKMGLRYQETGEAVPALAVAGPSAAMALFYAWCLVAGPTPSKAGGRKKGGGAVRRSGRTPTKRRV